MISVNNKSLLVCCFVLTTSRFAVVHSISLPIDLPDLPLTGRNGLNISLANKVSNIGRIIDGTIIDTTSILQDPVTKALCSLETDELIEYYGYLAEKHQVTTEDGYILTVFRCNSNKTSPGNKKTVILQHGLLSSSDDYCTNIPSQGLAYIMADEEYDVFLPNARANFYSRSHITLSPNQRQFWNFSWYEIGVFDYPAVYNYVTELTGNQKHFVVGHSQSASATMAVLSEMPEINDIVHAVSLMAPVGYLNNSGVFYQFLKNFQLPLETLLRDTEFLPRGIASGIGGTICGLGLESFCDSLLFALYGQSKDQRNETMVPTFLPSGSSFDQIIHFGTEVRYGYFGKYKLGSEIPSDFNLSQISAPISLHFSPNDALTNPVDVHRLIPQLKSLALVQEVNEVVFHHMDFIWGKNAAKIVYSQILEFFKNISTTTRP